MGDKTACKICIAQKGLKGSELDKCDYVFDNEEDFMNHVEDVHHFKIKDRPPRTK